MPHSPDADFIARQEALAGEHSLDREVAWALACASGAGTVHRHVTAEPIIANRGGERALVMGPAAHG